MSDSAVNVSLGSQLIYNGQEQTQSIVSVRVGNTDISYRVEGNTGTQVDVYYMTLYSTEAKNVVGSTQVKWTIAPDTSKIDGLTVDNVTSADEDAIREVLDSIQTDAAKREWAGVIDYCEELLDAIKNAANSLSDILDALNAYDIDTVKSSDQSRIERLDDEIDKLLGADNLTDEQREALEAGKEKADALLGRIEDVADMMADITDRLSKYEIPTVKSTDKADITDILGDINQLLGGDNLTATERAKMEIAKAKAQALLRRIQDAYDQTHTDDVVAAAALTKENVKGSDRATIESAIKDLELAIANYPGNYTDTERKAIDDELARLRELLVIARELEAAENERKSINDLLSALDRYHIDTVKSSDRADIEDIKADLEQLLKGGSLDADDRAAVRQGVDKANALLGRISDVAAKMQYIKSALSRYDINTVKSSDKVNIENILADILALLKGDNLTSTERIEMEGEKATAEALLKRIQDAYDQSHTPNVQTAGGMTEATVQPTDRAIIEGAIKDLNRAIELYPGNYTTVERKEIDDELARLQALLDKLDAIGAVQDMIDNLPDDAQPGDDAAKDAYDAAKDAYDALGADDKEKVNADKLDALGDMLKAYAIIEGRDGVWVKRSKQGLGFLANGSCTALYQILIDDEVIAVESYTASAPYTTLTLHPEYLKTLDKGEHKLTVRYGDGEASCNFTVEAKGLMWLWILLLILLVLIGSGYLCYSIYNKKESSGTKA
jgi:hypothetical protein